MQRRSQTSQTSLTDFKPVINQGANEIAANWLKAVRAERAGQETEDLEEPLLLNAVPPVLEEILRCLESVDKKIKPEKICRAARHGRKRARKHFNVRELVREYQLLRKHLFLYLKKH